MPSLNGLEQGRLPVKTASDNQRHALRDPHADHRARGRWQGVLEGRWRDKAYRIGERGLAHAALSGQHGAIGDKGHEAPVAQGRSKRTLVHHTADVLGQARATLEALGRTLRIVNQEC